MEESPLKQINGGFGSQTSVGAVSIDGLHANDRNIKNAATRSLLQNNIITESQQIGSANNVMRPQQQRHQQSKSQISFQIQAQHDINGNGGNVGMISIPQKQHLPIVTQSGQVQQAAPSTMINPNAVPNVPGKVQVQQPAASTMVHPNGKQATVVQKGRFSIMKKEIPKDLTPTKQISDTTMIQQGANRFVNVDEGVVRVQGQQQHLNLVQNTPQQSSQAHLMPAPENRNMKRFSSAPSNGVQQSIQPPPPVETQIKGRFFVTKAADKETMAHHVKSQSLGAISQQQYVQRRPANNMNLQQPAPGQQQPIHSTVIDNYGHRSVHSAGSSPLLSHEYRNGVKSAGSSPLVSHEYVQSVNTLPIPPIINKKPPIQPKGLSLHTNAVQGGSVTAVSGSTNKMLHFLDQMKIEAMEADKMMKFLRTKNKELEANGKDLEKRYLEERVAREEADAKIKLLMIQVKDLKAYDAKLKQQATNMAPAPSRYTEEENDQLKGILYVESLENCDNF